MPDTALERAFTAIAAHRAGPKGTCLGCLADGAGVVPSPCAVSREALAVIETHGVRHWDTPDSDLPPLRAGGPLRGGPPGRPT